MHLELKQVIEIYSRTLEWSVARQNNEKRSLLSP